MVDQTFAGKTAVVTGAASGIGRATALLLAARGARVVVADINGDGAAATAQLIAAAGGAADAMPCDVAEEAQIITLVDHARQLGGRLDVMINNAGIGGMPRLLHKTTNANWHRVLAVNLTGVFWGQKYAVRAMLADRQGGAIVNVSSVAGLGGAPTLGPYGVAKAGVIQLTQTAALELAQHGIRINAVCPGWVDTPMLSHVGEEGRAALIRQVPMARLGTATEIAELIVFLASDAASFISGVAYPIDGGMRS